MKVYIGTIPGDCDWRVHVEDAGLVRRLDEGYGHGVCHSPDGFAWGYSGSGPAQLAFAILADAFGPDLARLRYQDFKTRTIARLDKGRPFRLWFGSSPPDERSVITEQ